MGLLVVSREGFIQALDFALSEMLVAKRKFRRLDPLHKGIKR